MSERTNPAKLGLAYGHAHPASSCGQLTAASTRRRAAERTSILMRTHKRPRSLLLCGDRELSPTFAGTGRSPLCVPVVPHLIAASCVLGCHLYCMREFFACSIRELCIWGAGMGAVPHSVSVSERASECMAGMVESPSQRERKSVRCVPAMFLSHAVLAELFCALHVSDEDDCRAWEGVATHLCCAVTALIRPLRESDCMTAPIRPLRESEPPPCRNARSVPVWHGDRAYGWYRLISVSSGRAGRAICLRCCSGRQCLPDMHHSALQCLL